MLSKPGSPETFVYTPGVPLKQSKTYRLGLETGLVLLLLGLALLLRLYNLTHLSLWFDDAFDIYVAHEFSFLDTLDYNYPYFLHPPLFLPVMHLWMRYIGLSEFALRSFSVLVGLLTLGLVYVVARHWLNQKIALVSLILLMVSPLHVGWSQSVRPYALLTLQVAITMTLALFASDQPRQNWRWLLYSLSLIILIYTHYLGLHLAFAQAIFFGLVLYKDRGALIRASFSLIVAGLAFLPWLGTFLEQARNGPDYYTNRGPLQLLDTVQLFAAWFVQPYLVFVVGAIFLPLLLLGLDWLWRNGPRKVAIWLVCWGALPVLTAWASSVIRPNFLARYFVFCLPPILIIVAAGFYSLLSQRRKVAYLGLTILIALNLAAIYNYHKNYRSQDWREVVNYVVAQQQPGDIVLLPNPDGYTQAPFDYYYVYLLGSPGNLERRTVNGSIKPQPALFSAGIALKQQVTEVFKGHTRVWLPRFYDGNVDWMQKNVMDNIPPEFIVTFYREYYSTEQGTISLILYTKVR